MTVEVGEAHRLIPIYHVCKPGAGETLLGYMWEHLHLRTGERCDGIARVCRGHDGESKERWDIDGQFLSLRPSLLCERCGLHGFVTDSEWQGTQALPQHAAGGVH